MRYPICWDRERAREVLTTESRQKVRPLFLQTHRPFQRIRVDFCKDQSVSTPFIDEDLLRTIVQSGALSAHNRLFFVVGEAGSGKSELSQWLEYTADTRISIPIHIPRSMTSAIQVAGLLRERLHAGGASALRRSPPQRQAEYISLAAIVLLYEHGSTLLAPAALWEALLASDAIRAELRAYLEHAAVTTPEKTPILTLDHLRQLCQTHDVPVPEGQLESVHAELQRLLMQAIDQTLWVGDIRALLRQLSADAIATQRRPLLLIEDITAFQSLGDILLDYLLDLTSGNFDAVIGVTTGFERTQLAKATLDGDLTHIHHRLRARFVLTDEHGRSYGLEDDLIEFTRTYLRAIRPDCASCPLQLDCDALFGQGLYPFTETMLLRAFRSLQEEGNPRQTPRLFLEHILGAVLLADDPPPLVLDRSLYLTQPPALFRSDEIPSAPLASLLRWYGDVSDSTVQLPAPIPRLWELEVPAHLLHGERIAIPRTYIVPASGGSAQCADWQQELRELQRWLTEGGHYPSRETLKRGIERILLMLGDPRALGSPRSLSMIKAEIYYARGDERLPIFLGGESGDLVNAMTVKIQVAPRLEDRALLEELAYLTLSDDTPARVCQNLATTLEWAMQHWQRYQDDVRRLLASRLGGITAEALVLVAWQLLCRLAGEPWRNPPPLRSYADAEPAYAAITPWSVVHHPSCYSAGKALFSWYERVRRLFIGMFTLRETLLDLDAYAAVLADYAPSAILRTLAAVSAGELRTLPFKLRPGGEPLHQLVAALQPYAAALTTADLGQLVAADLHAMRAQKQHLADQDGLDMATLQQLLGQLRWRCGEVGVAWQERWDAALVVLQALNGEELGQLAALADRSIAALQALIDEHRLDIWVYQEWLHAARPLRDHPYWEALAQLRQIQAELLRTARARYPRRARLLSRTAAYQELRQSIRVLALEIGHGEALDF